MPPGYDDRERRIGMLEGEYAIEKKKKTDWRTAWALICFVVKPDEPCCSRDGVCSQVLFHKIGSTCVTNEMANEFSAFIYMYI